MNRRGKPVRVKTPHIRTPTINVDRTTPKVASTAIGTLCRPRSPRSTCRAPAKSRKPIMPCKRTRLKSNSPMIRRLSRATSGATMPTPRSPREKASDRATRPIVVGSLSRRMLMKLKPAASTIRIASRSNSLMLAAQLLSEIADRAMELKISEDGVIRGVGEVVVSLNA